MGDPGRLAVWESRTAVWLTGGALAYLVLFAADVLWLSMPPGVRLVSNVVQLVLWMIFVADFGVRIALSGRPWRYIASHPIDLVTIVLPAARALRVLRVFSALRVLTSRGAKLDFGRMWLAVAVAVVTLAGVGALVVLDAERGAPDATIVTFPDALWWSVVTLTTVGYGDEYPVTAVGQIAAAMMMVVGIGLLGTVTATVATWFTRHFEQAEVDRHAELLAELAELRAAVDALRSSAADATDPSDARRTSE